MYVSSQALKRTKTIDALIEKRYLPKHYFIFWEFAFDTRSHNVSTLYLRNCVEIDEEITQGYVDENFHGTVLTVDCTEQDDG